jgi:NADPH:quinone reductase-like Zn-dependent oxidoreductase
MKLKRILKSILKWGSLAILLALFVGIILLFIAYWRSTNDCDQLTAAHGDTMKAIVYCDYGPPDVLKLMDIPKPVPNDNQVLVKVRAASVNPYDWHFIRGTPYIMRLGVGLRKPKVTRIGVDFAGTIEAVGKNPAAAGQFKPGDEVFGGKTGAFAEYVCVSEKGVALKPANITFEQAGSVAIAGLTALQAVRDKAKAQRGQKILINGASGGVGTFAVQIAKSFGADVTGVCSTRNVDLVRSLGADHVIDYTKEDFTKSQQRYDVIIDNVGNQPLLSLRRALTPKGKYVMIGGGGLSDQGVIGPMFRPIRAILLSPFVSQQMGMMLTDPTQNDYKMVADLMQAGKVTPVIDRRYKLSEVPAAIAYLEQGHARGKVVITLE